MLNIMCSHKVLNFDNSPKNTKFKKIFVIPNSTLEELFNDATHISLPWIYRSGKIVWTKKTHLSILFLPPQVGSEQQCKAHRGYVYYNDFFAIWRP